MIRQTERKGGSGLAGGINESGAGARRHNKQLASPSPRDEKLHNSRNQSRRWRQLTYSAVEYVYEMMWSVSCCCYIKARHTSCCIPQTAPVGRPVQQ